MVINDTRKLCGIRYKDVKAVEDKGPKKRASIKLERVVYLTIITILVGMLLSPSIEGNAFAGGGWGVMEAGVVMSYGVDDALRVWKEVKDKAKFYIDEKFRRFVSILGWRVKLQNILLTDDMDAVKAGTGAGTGNRRYSKKYIKDVKDVGADFELMLNVGKSNRNASVSKANKVQNKGNYYNVQEGDSIRNIAKKLKVSAIDLALLNNLEHNIKLKKGLVLKIPGYLYL